MEYVIISSSFFLDSLW